MPPKRSSTRKKKKAPASPDGLANSLAALKINKPPIQTISGSLAYPMLSGRWEIFDHTTNNTRGFCLMRMILHNGAKDDDFQLSWVDNKTFKV